MALLFYPIEDKNILEAFHQRLERSPFLEAVWKALNEAGTSIKEDETPEVVDEVISTLSTATDLLPLMTEFYSCFRSVENRTLTAEHEILISINLKYDNFNVQ